MKLQGNQTLLGRDIRLAAERFVQNARSVNAHLSVAGKPGWITVCSTKYDRWPLLEGLKKGKDARFARDFRYLTRWLLANRG